MTKRNVRRHAVEQPQDESIKLIPLTKNQTCTVDSADYEWLNQWNWFAQLDPTSGSYYAVRNISDANGKQRPARMNRVILELTDSDPRVGDHRNGNTLDNRRSNLRPLSSTESAINQRLDRESSSGRRGITRHRHGWMVRITVDGDRLFLGCYNSLALAKDIRLQAEKDYFGQIRRIETEHVPLSGDLKVPGLPSHLCDSMPKTHQQLARKTLSSKYAEA
jgi:hypothetical protein